MVSIGDSCDFSAGVKIFKFMLLFEFPQVEYLTMSCSSQHIRFIIK